MTVVNAKARLDQQEGDPVSGYIAKADAQASYDDLEDGWQTDDATMKAGLVKADVGLDQVDNTSDVDKPVSDAQALAIAAAGGGTATPEDGFYYITDYGAVINNTGVSNTTAIQAAIDAANAAGGGTVVIPGGGDWTIGAQINMKSYVHIVGREPASRYHGHAVTSPPSNCSLRVNDSFTTGAVFYFPTGTTASSIQALTIKGRERGTVHGIDFQGGGTEQNYKFRDLNIISMGGDGVRGKTWATRWESCVFTGCNGWGLNATLRFNDTRFFNCYINGNASGGLNMDGSDGISGLCKFIACRFERSGWDVIDQEGPPNNANAPGIRLRKACDIQFIGCETDANTGSGVDISATAPGQNYFNSFISCNFRRDGQGDMVTQSDHAAVKIVTAASDSLSDFAFIDCYVSVAHASDGSPVFPAYIHPRYGLWAQGTQFLKLTGGHWAGTANGTTYSESPAVAFYSGGLDWNVTNWRSEIYLPRAGIFTGTPVNNTASRPTLHILGMQYFDTSLGRPIWWNGSNWKDAAGTTV